MGLHILLSWPVTPEELHQMDRSWPGERTAYTLDDLAAGGPGEILPRLDVMIGVVDPERLRLAESLRLIHVLGHGIDPLLQPEVRRLIEARAIPVARANPAAINIAEFVMTAMVALTRRLLPMHHALVRRGSWSPRRRAQRFQGSMGGELHGRSLGLVGLGAIGRAIVHRARAFSMTVGAVVRRPERLNAAAEGLAFLLGPDGLEECLSRSDYVVLAMPLTAETRNLMNADRFAAMKPGSYLINISRGSLVVEEALYDALVTGHLAGAALDVWRQEDGPARTRTGYPSSFPLHHHNVIMTPHYAGATLESRQRAIMTIGDNLRRLEQGRPLRNVADLSAGY